MITLCTLFDHNYLDKGLVLYKSLEANASNYKLYVLAMSDKCYDVLVDLDYPNLIPIKLSDFEKGNDALLEAKANRPFGRYCWTCGSSLIKYIFETFNPENCTYIDSDMYFYEDPQILLDEMLSKKASALVVGHRFSWYDKDHANITGQYCVEFNPFLNNKESRELLNHWVEQCIECCEPLNDGIHYGDQMYINNWVRDYKFVVETEQLGAGVAPWNFDQYKMVSHDVTKDKYIVKCRGREYPLIFMHFENIVYLSEKQADVGALTKWTSDRYFGTILYTDYLRRVNEIKKMLSTKYGIKVLIKKHIAFADIRPDKDMSFISRFKGMLKTLCTKDGLLFYFTEGIPYHIYRKYNIINID